MDQKAIVNYWRKTAQHDRIVAEDLFRLKHYHTALFMWQLVLERLLKSRIAAAGGEVIPTHNLIRLAKETGLKLSNSREEQLAEITTFNIEARYDDYKHRFYKKATRVFTERWVKVCEDLYQFIESND